MAARLDGWRVRTGGGRLAAPGAAGWLGLAAAPSFALMAVLTAFGVGGQAEVICSTMQHDAPLGGMATMYLLMSLFHLPPWIRLVRRGY